MFSYVCVGTNVSVLKIPHSCSIIHAVHCLFGSLMRSVLHLLSPHLQRQDSDSSINTDTDTHTLTQAS